jgi:uncharacterized hydrophobic protein (TIGR00271 family)
MSFFEFIRNIIYFFSLEAELEDQDSVYEQIKKNIVFKGTNLWILIFAIIVASVGLNMNSTAVIIGAMLISPLMGPINGMGYSIATYDFELFRKSIKNFSFAILASLFASTTYFALSPISTAHSELLARTSPTIYDVLIALFGGLAGIVAISSKQKGNVIPGVAIATALMPPLCTAGYGIASRQLEFFLGAFYLFTINTIFIAIATVWISQLLKFPIRNIVDERRKKRINRTITLVITIVLLPSLFFGYKLVQHEDFKQKANLFISNVTIYEGNFLLKSEVDVKNNTITLIYGGSILTEEQKKDIIRKSYDFSLDDANIIIEQGLALANVDGANIELFKLKAQIVQLNAQLNAKNEKIDSLLNKQQLGVELLEEIKVLFPQITACLYAESYSSDTTTKKSNTTPIVILNADTKMQEYERRKIKNWLAKRLNNDAVKLYFE